jgi:predicted RNA-binding Zn ribbon-like protein
MTDFDFILACLLVCVMAGELYIIFQIDRLIKKGAGITMTLDELQVQVTENTSLEQSAITLIQGIAAQLAAAAQDPAKIQALSDQLNASADALAAAIQANTPAVPA